ncbi:MAG: class I SAM-dependent methyltransferase [Microthrixaceae bacterium]
MRNESNVTKDLSGRSSGAGFAHRARIAYRTRTLPSGELCRAVGVAAAVVDIGGGDGLLSLALLNSGAEHVTCVDIDPFKTASLRRFVDVAGLKDSLQVITADAVDVLASLGTVDAVTVCDVLYLLDDDEVFRVLAECVASLGVGGRLVITEIDPQRWLRLRAIHLQEFVATRILKVTKGEFQEIRGSWRYAAILEDLGCSVTVARLRPRLLAAHFLLVATRPT